MPDVICHQLFSRVGRMRCNRSSCRSRRMRSESQPIQTSTTSADHQPRLQQCAFVDQLRHIPSASLRPRLFASTACRQPQNIVRQSYSPTHRRCNGAPHSQPQASMATRQRQTRPFWSPYPFRHIRPTNQRSHLCNGRALRRFRNNVALSDCRMNRRRGDIPHTHLRKGMVFRQRPSTHFGWLAA